MERLSRPDPPPFTPEDKPPTPGTRCANCKFLGVMPGGNATICRRGPPAPFAHCVMANRGPTWLTATAWPAVNLEEWCGSFEPRVAIQ